MKLKIVNESLDFIQKNKRHILTGLSIGGTVIGAYSWMNAGIKARDILERHHRDMADCDPDDKEEKRAITLETIGDLAPYVVPSTLITFATAGMIFANDRISSKEIALLAGAYAMSDKNLKATREKLRELFGKEKEQEVRSKVAEEKVKNRSFDSVIYTGDGDVLCMDYFSDQLFRSTAERIGRVINKLSSRIISEMWIPLNDLYEELGIERKPFGDDYGWNIDDCIEGKLPIDIHAVMTKDNKPCILVDYDVHLRIDYRNLR